MNSDETNVYDIKQFSIFRSTFFAFTVWSWKDVGFEEKTFPLKPLENSH